MSRKPLKRSEILRRARKAERRQSIRLMLPYKYIIFCEGTKTEPNYFRQIKTIIEHKYRDRLLIEQHRQIDIDIIGTGRSTSSLLNFALDYISKQKNKYDYVWLIFDNDDFPQADFDNTITKVKALAKDGCGDEPRWHCGWSNQCIELWFLLHFEFYHVAHHRDHYIDKLSAIFADKGLGEYKKNAPGIFQLLCLHGSLPNAIRNAKRLFGYHANQTPSHSDPATSVFLLLDDLLPYIEEALDGGCC